MFTTKRWPLSALCAQVFLLGAFSILDGCSSDDQNAGPGRGQGCDSGEDCTLWSCTCNDQTTVSIAACVLGECQDGSTACGNACESRGGAHSFREKQTVKDSAECNAFCAKAASLGCRSESPCDRHFYCDVDEDECADAKRAHLQCVVDSGQWACTASGGWMVTSGCPSARCARDAGAD